MSESTTYPGGCYCGTIRYVARAVFDAGYCHCSICRRISGAPAACWFNVREEHFAVTSSMQPTAYRSSEHFARYFCSKCGTHLFGFDDLPAPPKVGSKLVSVMLGTLDDPESVRPAIHQWWSNHVSWYAEASELSKFELGAVTHPAQRQRREP